MSGKTPTMGDLFDGVEAGGLSPAPAAAASGLPPGAVRELVMAELARPAPRAGYIRGLAIPERDPRAHARLMELARSLD
ncbi:hypothetical protein [Acidihalobacter aeolianus]|nr:hypothetical protein [Acidihalobacter aeolianus]